MDLALKAGNGSFPQQMKTGLDAAAFVLPRDMVVTNSIFQSPALRHSSVTSAPGSPVFVLPLPQERVHHRGGPYLCLSVGACPCATSGDVFRRRDYYLHVQLASII